MPVELSPKALTTPERVRLESGTTGDDELLTRLINMVSGRVAKFCGREFGLQVLTPEAPELHAGSGSSELYVRHWPIRSVEEIRISSQEIHVEVISSTTVIPPTGDTVFRCADWDRIGMLYYPAGWACWARMFGDLAGGPNLSRDSLYHTITLAYTGGYVLPAFDGQADAIHNPDGDPADVPDDLEGAVVAEVLRRLLRPTRDLVEERTAGGWSQKWATGRGTESFFSPDNMEVLRGYAAPGAFWA